jgi:hypothetical protein
MQNQIFEPAMAQLMDEPNASLVRPDSDVFDDVIDQLVLAVPESGHRFCLRQIVQFSFAEEDIT